jgi:hypothetical protein
MSREHLFVATKDRETDITTIHISGGATGNVTACGDLSEAFQNSDVLPELVDGAKVNCPHCHVIFNIMALIKKTDFDRHKK